MKINLAVDLNIKAFTGFGITDYDSGVTNTIVIKENGKNISTQRPSIDVSEDSTQISGLLARARGIYYWEEESKLYIVNDDSLYEVTQDSVAVGTIVTGTERCTMLESIGTPYLILIDAQNNDLYLLDSAITFTQVTTNIPTTITHGGAMLNGRLYIMDENGTIYNSAVDDPTNFPATGFITAERSNDKGVYLGKHHDHIVAIGTQSIEFFYDSGSSVGSPLQRRQDVSYNIGGASGLAVWENGDEIYFLGSDNPGQIQIYKIENFQVKQISTDTINSYITQGITQESLKIVLSGLSAMGHDTLLMTVYTLTGSGAGEIDPKITISYDSVNGQWGFWNTDSNSLSTFPLVAWTKRTGGQNATVSARTGEGLLSNGDIININDRLVPVDTFSCVSVYESGVYEVGVYTQSNSDTTSNIPMIIRTGLQDAETRAYKFQSSETMEMESTSTSQTITIKHSDEASNDFDSGETIDTSDDRKDVYQGGRFVKRNYQIEYSGDEQIYLESLDVDISAGL